MRTSYTPRQNKPAKPSRVYSSIQQLSTDALFENVKSQVRCSYRIEGSPNWERGFTVEFVLENPEACFTSRFIEDLRNQPVEAFISSLVELPSTSNLSKVMGLLTAVGFTKYFFQKGSGVG